jgi:hypothetical protein
MAWSTPLTAVANTPLTAAQWNASVRDNLNLTPAALATVAGSIFVGNGANAIAERIPDESNVDIGETTASTTYTNLATDGPKVTFTSGTQALVIITAQVQNSTANISWASFEFTGATTVVAQDTRAIITDLAAASQVRGSACSLEPVTPGSNVARMQYRVTGGTGTWTRRRIMVIPL